MKKVFSLALVAGMFAFASCESKPAETEGAAVEAEGAEGAAVEGDTTSTLGADTTTTVGTDTTAAPAQ